MKKLIVVALSVFCLSTVTFAYTPTSTDEAIIDGFTDKIEKIIRKKWESHRDIFVSVVKNIANQRKTNEQMKFVLNQIADNLSVEKEQNIESEKVEETIQVLQSVKTNSDYIDPSGFSCWTKRYCKDMVSCTEASYYYNVCNLKSLDRDKDGIYCENVCK